MKIEPEKLADEHWTWLSGLWETLPDNTVFRIITTEYLYKSAFIHGWKHAKEYYKKNPELTT